MILACGLLTINDAFIKALVESLPVGQVIGLRSLFALTMTLMLLPWLGGVSRLKAKRVRDVFLCSGLLVFNIIVFPFCLPYLPLADAIILAYTSPIWVVFLAPIILTERNRWQQWLAVLIGLAGAALVIKPGSGTLHWAIVLPLIVGFGVALRDMVTRKIAARESALSIVACTNFLSILVGLASIPLGWKAISNLQLVQLVLSGALFSIAQLMMVEAFRHVEATVLSTFKYSSILFAAAFGYLFWGETLDTLVAMGAILIVLSGIMIVRYRHIPLPALATVD